MSAIRLIKSAFFLFATLLAFATFSVSVFGQCGVYLRQMSTQRFPYAKVYLDGSADMTGDGIPDLLASQENPNGGRARLFVIPNNGNGTFGSPVVINPPAQNPFIAQTKPFLVGDVNNDGRKDLITFFETPSPFILVYLNNGNGTAFTPQTMVPRGEMGDPQDLADVNNDGFGDYLGYFGSNFRYSLGNGNGTFQSPVTILSNRVPSRGDFNNDGKIDFVTELNLYLNQGNLTWSVTDVSSVFAGSFASFIGDFNGDGKSDVFSRPNESVGFSILTSTGSTFTRTDHVVSADPSWQGTSLIGNFSGNSSLDVIYQPDNLNTKAVYTNDGAGNFTRQDYGQKFYVTNFRPKLYADFDNDGKTDVVQSASRTNNGRVMLSDVTSFTFQKNVCDKPGQPRIVDFDGSTNTDFSYWNPSNGVWSSVTNSYGFSGESSETQNVQWGLGSLGDIPTPGDFDGDGLTDRAVFRESTGYWYIRRSSDLAMYALPFGAAGDKPVAADFDGDTVTDIAVWRPSDGYWYIIYSGTQQFAAIQFGLNGDKPVPADFDGDRKTDVAVYRPSSGFWYYLNSSNGSFAAFQYGISTDKPIPADFDGDGKADLAVYRDSVHGVYINMSYESSSYFYPFGISEDLLQVGDYDGDFVADLGVYRPSTKAWWTTAKPPFFPAAIFGTDNAIPTSSVLRLQ